MPILSFIQTVVCLLECEKESQTSCSPAHGTNTYFLLPLNCLSLLCDEMRQTILNKSLTFSATENNNIIVSMINQVLHLTHTECKRNSSILQLGLRQFNRPLRCSGEAEERCSHVVGGVVSPELPKLLLSSQMKCSSDVCKMAEDRNVLREKGTHMNECRCMYFKPGVNMLSYLDKVSVETCRMNCNLINQNTSGVGLDLCIKAGKGLGLKCIYLFFINNQSDTFESQISVIWFSYSFPFFGISTVV